MRAFVRAFFTVTASAAAANAIGPVLIKNFGKNKKAAFMTPDYTYGHTVTKSVNEYLSQHGDTYPARPFIEAIARRHGAMIQNAG